MCFINRICTPRSAIDGEPGKRHSLIEAWRPMTMDINRTQNILKYILQSLEKTSLSVKTDDILFTHIYDD